MKRRWMNVFKSDGRAFVLAMDHGGSMNVLPDMADPGKIIRAAVAGGVDAILTTVGIARNFGEAVGNAGLLLRMDGGTSQIAVESAPEVNLYTVEDMVRFGADGIVCMGFPGTKFEEATLTNVARNAAECSRWGIVMGAEMLPRGFEPAEDNATEANVALSARIGAELGADFIKTRYTGDPVSFHRIVEGCYRPILVLGGEKVHSDRELLAMIREAVDAGASGVVIGRNIWRRPNVERICAAIAMIIHGNSSVDAALAQL